MQTLSINNGETNFTHLFFYFTTVIDFNLNFLLVAVGKLKYFWILQQKASLLTVFMSTSYSKVHYTENVQSR